MIQMKTSRKISLTLSIIVVFSLIGLGIISTLIPGEYSYSVSSFQSYDELLEFLKTQSNHQNNYYDNFLRMDRSPGLMNAESSSSQSLGANEMSYSETNIQVEGVDEPDMVKTDGSYIYILDDYTIYIIQAHAPRTSEIVSTILLNESYYYSSMFISAESLVVFGQAYPSYWLYYEPRLLENDQVEQKDRDVDNPIGDNDTEILPPQPGNWSVSNVSVQVYDIADRNDPSLVKTIQLDGSYVNARMIDSFVYVIASEATYDVYRVMDGIDYIRLPKITIDGAKHNISAEQIFYADEPEEATSFTHVLTLNLNDYSTTEKSFLIGNTHELYMSNDNLYLVYTSYEYTPTLFSTSSFDYSSEITKIHKIHIDESKISYIGSGEVQGRLLNQFSMDEHNDYFRVATTSGYSWSDDSPSMNQVYILDDELNVVSSITNIAPGEQIYSARFMGDTAYLVTFKNIDPFFTLDLSDPYNPKILGELKLPGYSDYLHPYDEHHIIGIGKDTVASDNPNFAWYQGVKIALFNVSDLDNPILIDTEIIGDRGSSTPVLNDHKALLFDKSKEVLVLPVSVYEIDDDLKQESNEAADIYGSFAYQGAYVYQITSNGFTFKDRITHMNQSTLQNVQNQKWYYGDDQMFIQRTLYIQDVLYTISSSMIQAHTLESLDLINQINLSDS